MASRGGNGEKGKGEKQDTHKLVSKDRGVIKARYDANTKKGINGKDIRNAIGVALAAYIAFAISKL